MVYPTGHKNHSFEDRDLIDLPQSKRLKGFSKGALSINSFSLKPSFRLDVDYRAFLVGWYELLNYQWAYEFIYLLFTD